MECPVCGSELTRTSEYHCPYGIEEYHDKCMNCNLFSEDYAFGHTEIQIGDFLTGYGHSSSKEMKDDVFKGIEAISKLLRESS